MGHANGIVTALVFHFSMEVHVIQKQTPSIKIVYPAFCRLNIVAKRFVNYEITFPPLKVLFETANAQPTTANFSKKSNLFSHDMPTSNS